MITPSLFGGLALTLASPPTDTPLSMAAVRESAEPTEATHEPTWTLPSATIQSELEDERPMYITLGAGITWTDDSPGPMSDLEFDTGYGLSLAIGRNFGHEDGNALGFDLEGELLYTDTDVDRTGLQSTSDITMIAGFVNGLADYRLTSSMSLFAGAGIGAAGLNIGDIDDGVNNFDEDDGPFLAWQLKGGARWHITNALAIELTYRYLNVDDAELDDDASSASFDLETTMHMASAGLQFGF